MADGVKVSGHVPDGILNTPWLPVQVKAMMSPTLAVWSAYFWLSFQGLTAMVSVAKKEERKQEMRYKLVMPLRRGSDKSNQIKSLQFILPT